MHEHIQPAHCEIWQPHIQNLWPVVQWRYQSDPTGHDVTHILNTITYAKKIVRTERKGDLNIIVPALQLHDLHQCYQWAEQRSCSPEETLPEASALLHWAQTPPELIPGILACIQYHNISDLSETEAASSPWETEIEIVRDADCSDQTLERLLRWMDAYNTPLYEPDALRHTGWYDAHETRSSIGYLHKILLPLSNTLHTTTGAHLFEKNLNRLHLWQNQTIGWLIEQHTPDPTSSGVQQIIFQHAHST